MLKNTSRKEVSNALALSAGGTRGYAQLGALQVLIEKGYEFDAVSGTSVGSLVAVCYASKKSIDEIVDFVISLPLYKFLKPKWGSLISTEKIVDLVLDFIEVSTFEELRIPVFINATDINTGEEVCFSSGKLKPALRASIAIPGIFNPVKVKNKLLVDGGTSHIIPFHLLPDAQQLVVINVGFKFERITKKSSLFSILQNAMFSLQKHTIDAFPPHTLVIEPNLSQFSFYEYKSSARKRMLKRGRRAAFKAINQLSKTL